MRQYEFETTLSKFQGFSENGLRSWAHDRRVESVTPLAQMAAVRDLADQRLRDVTIAVAIAAAAGVGVIAWVSAATIPGWSDASGATGNATAALDDQSISPADDGFVQAPPGRAQFGSGVAVSGGSK